MAKTQPDYRDFGFSALAYYSDIIFAIILAFYFFTGLYGLHFFNPQVFRHYILSSGHTLHKLLFLAIAIPFVLYLYFIPYALWRKSKGFWFSRACYHAVWLAMVVIVSFYMVVYWTGYFDVFLHNQSFYIGLLFIIGWYGITFVAMKGSLEIYLTSPYYYEIVEEAMYRWEMEELAKQQKKVQQQKPQPQPKQSVQREVKERLKGLKELLDDGLISEEDYKRKKEEILKGL